MEHQAVFQAKTQAKLYSIELGPWHGLRHGHVVRRVETLHHGVAAEGILQPSRLVQSGLSGNKSVVKIHLEPCLSD